MLNKLMHSKIVIAWLLAIFTAGATVACKFETGFIISEISGGLMLLTAFIMGIRRTGRLFPLFGREESNLNECILALSGATLMVAGFLGPVIQQSA